MKKENKHIFRSPKSLENLDLKINNESNGEVIDGMFYNKNGEKYIIKDGIIDFTVKEEIKGIAKIARDQYKIQSKTYDKNVDITFELYNEKSDDTRNFMVNLLNLSPENDVLEISSGTGLDSEIIISQLSEEGSFTSIDISPDMVKIAYNRLKNSKINKNITVGNACSLPFNDNSFDALYCFSGIGHFPDIKKGLKEMSRVVKKGGKVVFCEKNVPPWLKNTTYGKILINHNKMFDLDNPLGLIPIDARNVGIRWILGNVHYVVDYEVGEGEPKGNFDLEIPGKRGGTFNTRYYGKIEGVTRETKKLVQDAIEASSSNAHEWIDETLKKEANKLLDNINAKNYNNR